MNPGQEQRFCKEFMKNATDVSRINTDVDTFD